MIVDDVETESVTGDILATADFYNRLPSQRCDSHVSCSISSPPSTRFFYARTLL